jgi:hypothetical protein
LVYRHTDCWDALARLHYPALGPEEQAGAWTSAPGGNPQRFDRPIYVIGIGGLGKDKLQLYGLETPAGRRPGPFAPGEGQLLSLKNVGQHKKKLYVVFHYSNHVGWEYNLGKQKLSRHRIKTQ